MAKHKFSGEIEDKNETGDMIAGIIIWAVIIGVLAVVFG